MRLTMKYTLTGTGFEVEATRRPRPPSSPPSSPPTLPSRASRNGASSSAWPTESYSAGIMRFPHYVKVWAMQRFRWREPAMLSSSPSCHIWRVGKKRTRLGPRREGACGPARRMHVHDSDGCKTVAEAKPCEQQGCIAAPYCTNMLCIAMTRSAAWPSHSSYTVSCCIARCRAFVSLNFVQYAVCTPLLVLKALPHTWMACWTASSGTVPQFRCGGCTSQGAAPAGVGAAWVAAVDGAGVPPPSSPADNPPYHQRESGPAEKHLMQDGGLTRATKLDYVGSFAMQYGVVWVQLTRAHSDADPGLASPPMMLPTVPRQRDVRIPRLLRPRPPRL